MGTAKCNLQSLVPSSVPDLMYFFKNSHCMNKKIYEKCGESSLGDTLYKMPVFLFFKK